MNNVSDCLAAVGRTKLLHKLRMFSLFEESLIADNLLSVNWYFGHSRYLESMVVYFVFLVALASIKNKDINSLLPKCLESFRRKDGRLFVVSSKALFCHSTVVINNRASAYFSCLEHVYR